MFHLRILHPNEGAPRYLMEFKSRVNEGFPVSCFPSFLPTHWMRNHLTSCIIYRSRRRGAWNF